MVFKASMPTRILFCLRLREPFKRGCPDWVSPYSEDAVTGTPHEEGEVNHPQATPSDSDHGFENSCSDFFNYSHEEFCI